MASVKGTRVAPQYVASGSKDCSGQSSTFVPSHSKLRVAPRKTYTDRDQRRQRAKHRTEGAGNSMTVPTRMHGLVWACTVIALGVVLLENEGHEPNLVAWKWVLVVSVHQKHQELSAARVESLEGY